jgi:coenzyme F420-0:L-glutamate ligase / coenzyme F420-1:gamma-L-glutamate ligase
MTESRTTPPSSAPTNATDHPTRIEVEAYPWPEVTASTDLADLVASTVDVADGDVLLLTSKAVSKSEGLVVDAERAELVAAESVRVVARRAKTVIAQTRHGLVMAAAGVDASNVPAGSAVTLPPDSDASARELRSRLYEVSGRNVAVVITDTAGRAWRNGQIDLAVGCAGIVPLVDLAGSLDTQGNELQVTAPAFADELAGAGDLVKGKATGRPLARVRGLGRWVLPVGVAGPGAAVLVRGADDDLFGHGARDAVHAAVLRRDEEALQHFPRRVAGDPEPFEGLFSADPQARLTWTRETPRGPAIADAEGTWLVTIDIRAAAEPGGWIEAGRLIERAASLGAAHRLRPEQLPVRSGPDPGWQTVARTRWFVA